MLRIFPKLSIVLRIMVKFRNKFYKAMCIRA